MTKGAHGPRASSLSSMTGGLSWRRDLTRGTYWTASIVHTADHVPATPSKPQTPGSSWATNPPHGGS